MPTMKLEYDKRGCIKYHPDIHPNHMKPFTDYDLAYMCYWYEIDGRRNLSFALGRTETTIASKITKFKKSGEYEHYKNLWRYIERKSI